MRDAEVESATCSTCAQEFPSHDELEEHRQDEHPVEPRGLNLVGKTFGGDLLVREKYDQAPYDGSWIWLVENTTTGKAELWRSCDLTRIERKNERRNNTKYWGYNEYSWKNRMPIRLEDAQKRLDELQKSEVTEVFYVIRRKSDGAYYQADAGYLNSPLYDAWPFKDATEEPPNKLAESRPEWEWVKVEAKYRLTVDPWSKVPSV